MRKFIILSALCIGLVGCESSGNYEGQSAEYWFNSYDEAEAQVEDLRAELESKNNELSDTIYELDDIQVQLDDSLSEIDDLQDELSSAERAYKNLKDCILFAHDVDDAEDCYYYN